MRVFPSTSAAIRRWNPPPFNPRHTKLLIKKYRDCIRWLRHEGILRSVGYLFFAGIALYFSGLSLPTKCIIAGGLLAVSRFESASPIHFSPQKGKHKKHGRTI